MRITSRRRTVSFDGFRVDVSRTEGGVVELHAGDDIELAAALGFVHCHERQVQMMLMRLVAQGRLGECLASDEETLAIDVFMRDLSLAHDAAAAVEALTPEARGFAEAYASGVNAYLLAEPTAWELRLVRYRPEPWTVADTLSLIGLMSYVGLAQSQQDMEKLVVQAIRGGADVVRLKSLLAPHLDSLDEQLVELIRQVRVVSPLLPPAVRFLSAVPWSAGSNGWAVPGRRSASGFPLHCCDPHLEVNRLPAIWYETVMHTAGDYRIGITLPGVPGLVMGRTRQLAFGFTYGYMDMVDYFLEEVRDGRCRRADGSEPIAERREVVRRKGRAPVEVVVRETSRGVLEADPFATRLDDGLYLARAWSTRPDGVASSLNGLVAMPRATNVEAAQAVARNVGLSCNWVLADRSGGVAFQQSGRAPARQHSGLYPVPGWDERLAWQGLVPAEMLHAYRDPPDGLIASANDDVNPPAGPVVVNLAEASCRVDRIRQLLGGERQLSLDEMRAAQADVHSLQAERLMAVLRPLLPDTPAGRLLGAWDLCYDRDSRGATLFEVVYAAALRRVFGRGFFGEEAWEAVATSTIIPAVFFGRFDRVLLEGGPEWFGPDGRDAVLREVAAQALAGIDPSRVQRWGERQRLTLTNVFFAGKLPRFLGFDRGPYELAGCRATLHRSGIFRAHGRLTSFAASWRALADLGSDELETALPGGPSGNRFSRWYASDVRRWLEGTYKKLAAARYVRP